MSPLFQLVLFNFFFRWPPLFGRTFYSTFFLNSTFYSDGRPYLVALFIQQLVLFNNCFIQLLIPWMSPLFQLVLFNFLFRWPPLFGCTFILLFIFIQLEWPPLFGHPYFYFLFYFIFILFYSNFFFFFFFKKVSYLDSNPGPLDLQSGYLDR